MAASNYSLKVNRQLLDPNFESYRLSLDPIPTYTIELDAGESMEARMLFSSRNFAVLFSLLVVHVNTIHIVFGWLVKDALEVQTSSLH